MRKAILCLCLIAPFLDIQAQTWVDTTYNYQLSSNIVYGSDVDFAGNLRSLDMDVCVPGNDQPPPCGRPLLVVIHGGAFLTGTKADVLPQSVMKDFAKRGYVTASVNYRLGMFETGSNIHCNIGNGWDCLNMADTAEWLRANYRAMQDVKGAIRYLVVHSDQYDIDPKNVFVVGESAGAITALSVAYLDDAGEKPTAAFSLPDVNAPNAIYENQCIQAYGFDTSVASMNLHRPDLGDISGALNPAGSGYVIKGVGSFYGGMFADLFAINTYVAPPVLYMFHQPNDLLVPYGNDRVLAGYAYCAVTLGGCQYIVSRPYISGGKGIEDNINTLQQAAMAVPEYIFDSTNNNADCLQQVNDPSTIGHAVDNYALRTLHMAQLFAQHIDTAHSCFPTAAPGVNNAQAAIEVYPNPAHNKLTIVANGEQLLTVTLRDLTGKVFELGLPATGNVFDISCLPGGFYFLQVRTNKGSYLLKIIKAG